MVDPMEKIAKKKAPSQCIFIHGLRAILPYSDFKNAAMVASLQLG